MLRKEVISAICIACVGAAGVIALVLSAKKNKKEESEEPEETLINPYTMYESDEMNSSFGRSETDDLQATLEKAYITLTKPENAEKVFIPDEKPDLESYLKNGEFEFGVDHDGDEVAQIGSNVFYSVLEENVFDTSKIETVEEPNKTKWNTNAIIFSEDNMPVFDDADWNSEVNNIELISQEEYNGSVWPEYDRDLAVWYPEEGILATESLTPVDVVDNIGPTAFVTLLRNPGSVIYVKNDELQKCYEIWESDVGFEEALNDSGYDVDVRLE